MLVRHLDTNLTATWSEHNNLIRNKAGAVKRLRHVIKCQSVFNELEKRIDDPANRE